MPLRTTPDMPTALSAASFSRRSDLRRRGWTDRDLARAVVEGRLLRPRAGAYLRPDAPADVVEACRLGGRLACVSELARLGVFVLEHVDLHLHVHEHAAQRKVAGRSVRRHWSRLRREPHPRSISVEAFDAVLQAVRCQPARAALATLDSALHLGVLRHDDLDELFRVLPRRHRVLRKLIDSRAESGPETLVRLMLRTLGATFDIQVDIPGVGRVDFVVDGWLIVECDSKAFHSSWDDQRRDRSRDQQAAARGYATYRPIAEDIMWSPEAVQTALAGLLQIGGRRRA